jgi:16S rRNA (uracil1498-N3)-methyltransferase
MDLLVEKTTELGVSRIMPALTEFTVARATSIDSARAQRWRRLAVSAATQCGRASVPSVDRPVPFADAVRAVPQEAVRLLLWEGEHRVTLPEIHAARPEPLAVVLAVGPEGGFAAGEVALARAAGFTVSGLGPRTLRAETAAIVALALCQATWGDLSQQAD